MDLKSDSGQTTVEWLAIMAMIVALAGVLIAVIPDAGQTIVDTFEKIVNSVTP